MPVPNRPSGRLKLVASGVFFCGYLLFQIVYPVLPWFSPGFDKFTWRMYSGLDESPRFTVVFKDGSRRAIGNPLKVGGEVRILGPSVNQLRVLPPWLCANWKDAEAVVIRHARVGGEEIMTCRSAGR